MSTSNVRKAYDPDVEVIGNEENRTYIDLTDYENAHKRDPPTVTATVYNGMVDTDLNEEEKDCREMFLCNREDSVFFEGLEKLHSNSDPLFRLDLSLKEKAVEILQKNPWLASEIVSSRNRAARITGKCALKFPTVIDVAEAKRLAEKVVRVVTTQPVGGITGSLRTSTSTMRAMAAAFSPSAVNLIIADPITENTYEDIIDVVQPMIETSESLWNVLMVPLTEASTSFRSDKFLLVHSLDASLGDPATLYKLYSMLVSVKEVEPLNPQRFEKLEKVKKKILGGDPNFMRSMPLQTGMTKALSKARVNSSPRSTRNICLNRTSMWTINNEKIEAIKQVYNIDSIQWDQRLRLSNESNHDEPEVPFVSTNDILTSWFMSQNPDSAIGCLVADIRGRHNVPVDLAGNYQADIIYDSRRGETSTPAWIRASITRIDELLKRHGDRRLPGAMTLTGNPGVSIVSNWSHSCDMGIFETVMLDHPAGLAVMDPLIHFPIILDHNTTVSTSIGWNKLIVFRYSLEKLGALVIAPPSVTDESYDTPLDKPALFLS